MQHAVAAASVWTPDHADHAEVEQLSGGGIGYRQHHHHKVDDLHWGAQVASGTCSTACVELYAAQMLWCEHAAQPLLGRAH